MVSVSAPNAPLVELRLLLVSLPVLIVLLGVIKACWVNKLASHAPKHRIQQLVRRCARFVALVPTMMRLGSLSVRIVKSATICRRTMPLRVRAVLPAPSPRQMVSIAVRPASVDDLVTYMALVNVFCATKVSIKCQVVNPLVMSVPLASLALVAVSLVALNVSPVSFPTTLVFRIA